MNTRAYPWRTAFLCAVFETDLAKMLAQVSKATAAIEARLAAYPQPDSVECRAIEDARRNLATLGNEGISILDDAKRSPVARAEAATLSESSRSEPSRKL